MQYHLKCSSFSIFALKNTKTLLQSIAGKFVTKNIDHATETRVMGWKQSDWIVLQDCDSLEITSIFDDFL